MRLRTIWLSSFTIGAAAAFLTIGRDLRNRSRGLVAASGAALVGAGLMRRNRAGVGLAAAGAALMARAATNVPLRRLVGVGAGHGVIDVRKTITVDLPADRVFAFWENPANLPTVMHHVRDVRTTNEPGRWRWTVSGAAGVAIEFVTVVADRVQDRLLAWKTIEGSTVEHTGTIRFDPFDARRTRVSVRLSYSLPGGAPTRGVSTVIDADPKSRARWLRPLEPLSNGSAIARHRWTDKEDQMGLRGKYAYAIQIAKDVRMQGSADERDGKLYFHGTTNTQAEANKIWDAIKTIPEWPNEIVADIKATGGPSASGGAESTYTVKAGDTLSKIAKEHLGDANAYMEIFNANRDQLSDPDKIKPGLVLKIPQPAKR